MCRKVHTFITVGLLLSYHRHFIGVLWDLKSPKSDRSTTIRIWLSVRQTDASENAGVAMDLASNDIEDGDLGSNQLDTVTALLDNVSWLSDSLSAMSLFTDKVQNLAEVNGFVSFTYSYQIQEFS